MLNYDAEQVSTALEPMSCTQDLNKKWYMIAHPQQQCNWCESSDFISSYINGDFTVDVPYPVLAGASIFIASVYGLGIPILFFYIMYSHAHNWEDAASKDYGKLQTANLKKWRFVRRYGFLTSKTSERYYYWEVIIIIRKLMLSLITKGIIIKNQKSDPNSSARQALCNMFVLVIACTAQAYASPFAHTDANFAESGLLLCAVLLVLVGMGTRDVRDEKTGREVDDPPKVEAKLSTAESTGFYVVIYSVMAIVILGTVAIIMRRVGSLLHQIRVGRQRDGQKLSIQRSRPVSVTLTSADVERLQVEQDKTSKLPKVKHVNDWLNHLRQDVKDRLTMGRRELHVQAVPLSDVGGDIDDTYDGYYLALITIGEEPVSEKKISTVEWKIKQNIVLLQLVEHLESRGVGQYAGGLHEVLANSNWPYDQWLDIVRDMSDTNLRDLVKDKVIDQHAEPLEPLSRMSFEWVKRQGEEEVDEADMALPDALSELIHKSHLDAASAWFNEKRGDRYKRDGKCVRLFHALRDSLPRNKQLWVMTICGILVFASISMAIMPWFFVSSPTSGRVLTDIDKLEFLGYAVIPLLLSVAVFLSARRLGQKHGTINERTLDKYAYSKLSIGGIIENIASDFTHNDPADFRPSPGHVVQFQQRLMRLPGVFGVTVDDENCTISVEYDLAFVEQEYQDDPDAPEGVYPYNNLKARAEKMLQKAASSVVLNSCVFQTNNGNLPQPGILSGTLPVFVGGFLVLLFQISTQLNCKLTDTTPLNCSVYERSFGNNTNPGGVTPWLMHGAKAWNFENRSVDTKSFLEKYHGFTTRFGENGIIQNPCNADLNPTSDGWSFAAKCQQLGTVGRGCLLGRDALLQPCTFEPHGANGIPLSLPKSQDIPDEAWQKMQSDIHAYCANIRITQSNGDPVEPAYQKFCDLEFYWHNTLKHKCTQPQACIDFSLHGKDMKLWELSQVTSRCVVCNMGRVIFMVLAVILCSIPLVINVVTAGLRWHKSSDTQKSSNCNSDPQPEFGHNLSKDRFLSGLCSIAAVTTLIAIGEYGSAAGAAALFAFISALSGHAEHNAWKAIVASIARLKRTEFPSTSTRASVLRTDRSAERVEFEGLRTEMIHGYQNSDSSLCAVGKKSTLLRTIGVIHSCVHVALGLGSVIWGLVLFSGNHGDWNRLIQAGAVLMVSAKSRALEMSKSAPYWCAVGQGSRAGFTNKAHLQWYLEALVTGGLQEADPYGDAESVSRLNQTLRHTTIVNLACVLLVKLLSTVYLIATVVAKRDHWWAVPWYTLLIELFVTFFVHMNSTRCARQPIV
jgi:hypothetical protein